MAPSKDELTGTVIDNRWEVGSCIRRGELHRLYKATDIATQSAVHLKVLNVSASITESFKRGFAEQYSRISSISHPHVLVPNDFGFIEDKPYLVTQSYAGVTLKEAIQMEGRFAAERVRNLAEQIADALGAGHAAGIIHGSLSSNSIVLVGGFSDSEQAYVLDYGLSHFFTADDSGSTMTESGVLIGNPEYMAPEQIRGFAVQPSTDIYSFAIILYELLSGDVPFQQQIDGAEGVMDLLMRQANDAPPPLPADVELVEELQPAIRLGLQKEPAERPQTVAAFIRRFSEAISEPDPEFSLPASEDSYLIEEAVDYPQTSNDNQTDAELEERESAIAEVNPVAASTTDEIAEAWGTTPEYSTSTSSDFDEPSTNEPSNDKGVSQKPTALLAEFQPFESLDKPIEEYIASTSGEHDVPDFATQSEKPVEHPAATSVEKPRAAPSFAAPSFFDEFETRGEEEESDPYPPTLAADSEFHEVDNSEQSESIDWLSMTREVEAGESTTKPRVQRDTEIEELSEIGADFEEQFSTYGDSEPSANIDAAPDWDNAKEYTRSSRPGPIEKLPPIVRKYLMPAIIFLFGILAVVVMGTFFTAKSPSTNGQQAEPEQFASEGDSMIEPEPDSALETESLSGNENEIVNDSSDQNDIENNDTQNDVGQEAAPTGLRFGKVNISEVIIASESGKLLAQDYAKAYRTVAAREDKKVLLDELHNRMTEAVSNIRSELVFVITQYAKRENYGLIVGDDGSLDSTIYVVENLDPQRFVSTQGSPNDLSDTILRLYNEQLAE